MFRRAFIWFMSMSAALAASSDLHAEPALDRILSGAQVQEQTGCAVLRIDFNVRIRYLSHFPLDRGTQLSVKFTPVDLAAAGSEMLTNREAIAPPASAIAAVNTIEFDARPTAEQELLITFKHPVSFRVAAGGDFQSLLIAIAGPGSKPCTPIAAPRPGIGNWETKLLAETLPPSSEGGASDSKLSVGDRAAVSALMDRAREALGASDSDAAIKALERVLAYPRHEASKEALELLGLAYQRKGDLAKARSIYGDYLSRYRGGDDAKRVSDRLASLDKPVASPAASRAASRVAHFGEPGQPAWIITGSASEFYMNDQGIRSYVDPSLPPQVNQPADERRTYQNDVLSSLSLTALWGTAGYQSKFRFAGALDNKLETGAEIASVADLELDTTIRDWGVTTKFGRQSRNTDGILGRFDGAVVSYDALPGIRFDAVGGSPVGLRSDPPNKDGTYFYGAGVDFAPGALPFDTTLYGLQQLTGGFIDRQAVGTELRYADANKSAFTSLEYDAHANEIDLALANGAWTLGDKSTVSLSAEHRSSPSLDTRNALIGQPSATLTGLLAFYSKDEIYQLAKDRAAFANSASVGFSKPLNEHLQVNFDASWFDLTATPASGGVDANPDSGSEFYVSAQLIGSDLWKSTDLYTFGLRYASTDADKTFVTDVSARYPVNDQLRLAPRLRLGYRDGELSGAGWEEYSLMPSLIVDYKMTRDIGLEVESGAKFTQRLQSGTRDDETEYYVTAGVRYDFNLEGPVIGGQ